MLLAALVVLNSISLATNSVSLVVEVPNPPASPSQVPTAPATQVSSLTSMHLTPPTLFPAQLFTLVVPAPETAGPQPLPPPPAPQAAPPPVPRAAPPPHHQPPAALSPNMVSAVVSAGLELEPVPLVPLALRLTTTTSSACGYNIPKFGGCRA